MNLCIITIYDYSQKDALSFIMLFMDLIKFAIIGGLVAMLGFGISDFLAKNAIDKVGDLKTLLYVQLIGMFFLVPYLIKDSQMPVFSLTNLIYLSIFGLFNAIGYLMLYKSFQKGKISIVSPISSSYAILAAIISYMFFGEAYSMRKIVVIVIIILGVILTALDPEVFYKGYNKKDLAMGVPEALLVFVIFGVYTPFWNKFIATPGWIVWVILLRAVLAFFLIVYAALLKKISVKVNVKGIWITFILISLFEAVGSFGSAWALHYSVNNTSIAAAITSTFPLVTIILAYLFLNERLKKSQYFGITLIILGLVASPFL